MRALPALLLVMVSSGAEAYAKTKVLDIKLRFVPQENTSADSPEVFTGFASRAIALRPIQDRRTVPQPGLVGENTEKTTSVPVQTTEDIPAFATAVFRRCATEWGFKLDDGAELVLAGELLRFFVAEDSLYFAEVRLAFRLENRGGEILWEGVGSGDARRFGRSLKEENYNEVLSDATKEAFANLLGNPALQQAWAGKRADPGNVVIGVTPDALLADVLDLRNQGLSPDLLIAYLKQKTVSEPFTAQDLVKWKQAGLGDAVIQAALSRTPGAASQ